MGELAQYEDHVAASPFFRPWWEHLLRFVCEILATMSCSGAWSIFFLLQSLPCVSSVLLAENLVTKRWLYSW
jgi:hypothetical protein